MARLKFQTLTEQMFYVLICLREECCGMDILEKVPAITDGKVTVGSGTLYNLLEQFLEAGFIIETKVEGRKRSYIISSEGKKVLEQEYYRVLNQVKDYEKFFLSKKEE